MEKSPMSDIETMSREELFSRIRRLEAIAGQQSLESKANDDPAHSSDNDMFRLLVDSVCDYAIFMVDIDGQIASWNIGAQRIKGYTADEVIGRPISIFYDEEQNANNEPGYHLAQARANGRHESEGWRLKKDGSRFWADVVYTALYNSDGSLRGYAKVTRDLTERRRHEASIQLQMIERIKHEAEAVRNEQIQKINQQLESRVKERTEELEAFSYTVSHDLRAPLRVIKSYADALQDDFSEVLPGKGSRFLNSIRDNATKMTRLIDDLLSFAQLGKQELRVSPVNMNDLVSAVIEDIKATGDIQADIVMEPLDPVSADPMLLIQVLINLLSNAVKFSSKAEMPRVEVSSRKEANEVVYSIRDNGVGFDMQYAHKLFGVFQRLHSMNEFEGTGAGLAIVKRIIDKHHGRIWAEAEVGKGATFYFSLPA